MKRPDKIFLFLLFVFCFIHSSGQKFKTLKNEFYGLNINAHSKKIIKQIKKDDRFIPSDNQYDHYTFFYNNYHTWIRDEYLPSLHSKPDSAELAISYADVLSYTSNGSAKGGNVTMVKISYYFHKKTEAEYLLNSIWDRIKYISKDTADMTVGYRDRSDFQYGKGFQHGENHYLPRVSLLQNDRSDGLFIITLEYERKGY